MAPPQPMKVVYCPVCSMPAEFCEFGPDFEKCKPWLLENYPDLYPNLKAEAEALQSMKGLQVDAGGEGGAASSSGAAEATATAGEDGALAKKPSKKKKAASSPEVVVEKMTRNKRKCVTSIKGLELFGVKLSEASKKLGKKFATGASVVKGPTEKEQIDVQGDILIDIVDFITENWTNIPEEAIYFMEDGRKVPVC